MAPTQARLPSEAMRIDSKASVMVWRGHGLFIKGSSLEGIGTQCSVQGWYSGRCEQIHEYSHLINGLID